MDYAIDEGMRDCTSHHFEVTERLEAPASIVKVVSKYLRKDVDNPDLVMTRFQKPSEREWEDYYKDVDGSLEKLFLELPAFSVVMVNCQVNPHVKVMSINERYKGGGRPFCVILTK